MARKSYSQHFVPGLELGRHYNVSTAMTARLLELAGMSQGVRDYEPGGPEWKFERDGKPVTTKVRLTCALTDGRFAYWSAIERTAQEEPDWVQVQRHHAMSEGCDHWVLTPSYLQANQLECVNRRNAYYVLAQAAGWDSTKLEERVLFSVDQSQETVQELATSLVVPTAHAQVAVLRLWKKELVELPMSTHPMSEHWQVTGVPHGRA